MKRLSKIKALGSQEILDSFEVVERMKQKPVVIPDEAVAIGIWAGGVNQVYWHLGVISPFDRTRIIDRQTYSAPIRVTTFDVIYNEYFVNRASLPDFDFLRIRS